jgi:ketosteroid isomerase-like protein
MEDDLDAVLSFYHDDVIDMPAYKPMVRGKENLAADLKKGFEMYPGSMKKFELTVKEVIADGNLAVDVGTFSMLWVDESMPEGWADDGNYVSIWEKQEDGTWLMVAGTWNSHNNPWLDMMENQGGDVEEKSKGSSEVHSHDHNCNHDCTEEEQKNCEHHKEDTK